MARYAQEAQQGGANNPTLQADMMNMMLENPDLWR